MRASCGLDGCADGERLSLVPARAHHREDAPLSAYGAVGHERAVCAPALSLHELPLAHEPRNPCVNLRERVASGRVAEHERLELRCGEHRHPLLERGDGPGDRFEHSDLARAKERRRGGGAGR